MEAKLRIKEARVKAGLTQRELAEQLGVALTTLSGYETGRSDPKTEYLIPISRICNTTVDFLLGLDDIGGDEKRNPPAPAEPEQGDLVSKMEWEYFLSALGLADIGEDISQADADFLAGLLDLIRAWLQEKRKQH